MVSPSGFEGVVTLPLYYYSMLLQRRRTNRESMLGHYRIKSGNMACDLLNVFSRTKITSVICRHPFTEMKTCIGIKE
jgi:hypothetical protein